MAETGPAEDISTDVIVGLGFRPGASAESILAAVRDAVNPCRIRCLATVDRRATEPGLRAAAADLAVPIVAYTSEELASVEVPNPAARTAAALGTPSVAEAAALRAAPTGELIASKRVVGGITVAVAKP
ncbi:cobalamin biosynthesis protein [Nocardia transvalensis]|uniref:cobalamin biosynthesis protein n=1 Tax=Nocardia transvalensis TaxID=37333 RepID=UPI001894079D|nr:cobalamin biosynthesis protein [Nocardia transvalensis]MBF6329448.1 cobalamin biosynthesis protein [Nocardia transvalensis]